LALLVTLQVSLAATGTFLRELFRMAAAFPAPEKKAINEALSFPWVAV
jgi:hypothetical protein